MALTQLKSNAAQPRKVKSNKSSPKVIRGERFVAPRGGRPKSPQNCPFPFDDHHPIPRPTPLTTPNSIRIQSAVLPQYTCRTNRQTDTQSDTWVRRQVYSNSACAVLYF